MIQTIHYVVALAAALLSASPAAAQKTYQPEALAGEGQRLEAQLKGEAGRTTGASAAQMRREAEAVLARDPRRALALATAAIATEPSNAANWLAYVRSAQAVQPADWSERYRLQEQMTVAAHTAYLRATTRADEARALATLAEAYALREMWRPALNTYRASLQIADDPTVQQSYETLREAHGFRILDYKVDSDSASPRVCFQFSDPLATGRVDFSPFVAISGTANAAVTAESNQLCVDGLRHGQLYAFVLRQGLPSAVDETLLKNADYEVYVRDRSPQVRFTGRTYVLPRTGQEGIPVVSVNTSQVEIDIARIGDRSLLPTVRSEEFLAQLSRSSAAQIASETGSKIWSGMLDTASDLNRDVITAFPVAEAVGVLQPGVYVMTARPKGAPDNGSDWEPTATQWFVVSDLGLTAFKGKDGVHVFVRSLASAEPVANVELRLVARNNEVLATKASDANGYAVFDPGLARGQGGLAPGLVIASLETDYGFLDLSGSAFDLTDRGVKGRPPAAGVDAFLYAERGVYRTGETAFVSALLRDSGGVAVAGVPLTFVVKRPDGVEARRLVVEDQGLGGRVLSVPILPGAMRGTWRVAAFTDPKGSAVGETSFLVEDYVPERLDVVLTPKAERLRPGEPAEIDVEARYLFGAIGSGLEVSGEVSVEESSTSPVPGLEGFTVGLDDQDFEASTVELEETVTTDAEGRATVRAPIQEVTAPRPTQARVVLRVGEPGGHAVERKVVLPILPNGPVIGVRKAFGELKDGDTATFETVLAAPDGRRLAKPGVAWTLSRIEKRYQWYNSEGRWGYEPVESVRRVADGRLDLTVDAVASITAPVNWGSYRLDIAAPELGESAHTSLSFTVGWSGEATAETPDLLELNLDRASYRTGDTMKVRLSPRFGGKATLAVVGDRVQAIRVVDVPADGVEVSLPVEAGLGTGAYVVAIAHRPLDQAARRMPGRVLGLAWFEVDRSARSLAVTLDAPAQVRPRETLTIPVRVEGLSPGDEARVTVAAVDVGILNLTGYASPDPENYFLSQRQLGMEIRDLYGYLIDGMQGTRGAIRSGGDAEAVALEGIPPAQEPLARFSGLVRVAADGSASIHFELPSFNGTARIMAVAWTKDRVGHAAAETVIRDPVVVSGTLPRFLSIGDQSRFFIQVDNVEGRGGEYLVDVDIRGPVIVPVDALRTTLRLDPQERATLNLPVTGAGPGTATIDVTVSGGGVAVTQSYALRVQPGSGGLVRRTVRTLNPGASVTLSHDLVADLVPGTAEATVSLTTLAALDVPGLLAALDRFPYGCSEQIVSRAMPLLYVNRLAAAEALRPDLAVDERVRDAIERLLARQDSAGSFGLWSVGGNDFWLDAYVTDFLTRARERGFTVPQSTFNQALDRLRNFVANTMNVEESASDLAYAAYVLARNGRPVMGDLRYLADTKLAAFESSLARAQIGAALALLGDRGRAQTVFAAALARLREIRDQNTYRADYGSRLRDGAGLLALASEAGRASDLVQPVARILEDERASGRATSTQENAWMVLAADAALPGAKSLVFWVDGAEHKGSFYRHLSDEMLARQPLTIANAGAAPVQLVVSVAGNPLAPEPPLSRGYSVERSYFRLDGTAVNPAQVRQNERFVTVLKVNDATSTAARLLLVDRLPAGFEIDNPNLVSSGSVAALDWLKTEIEPSHAEYRDDRFVAAFDRPANGPASFMVAYIVRAVAPGRYVHPPAQIEDMYRPEKFGRTATGTVEIVAVRP
jgi:alpha-2-macroglobulin